MTSVGDIFELTVERIVPGGLGMAHAGGRTIFVSLSAPGDRALVRLDRVQGRVGYGTIERLIDASPSRTAPPCPVYGRCGGCDFQHLTDDAQLAAKREMVEDSLRRIGGIQLDDPVEVVASPRPWAYRAVAEWQDDPRSGAFGYFARDSRAVVDVATCPILEPRLDAELAAARAGPGQAVGSAPVELRAAAGDESSEVVRAQAKPTRELVREIGGERYLFDATCFFQANPSILEALIREIVRPIDEPGSTVRRGGAVDLYCGVGLFSVPLARRFDRVVGVEADAHTADFAVRNLVVAGLAARIEAQSVEQWLIGARRRVGRVSFLVLDPPRVGAKAAIPGILKLAPTRIAYVSCDPATLARDLRQLLADGYELERVTAFDMFPQTHHVEVVAHLSARV